jgi:hypothetical protein
VATGREPFAETFEKALAEDDAQASSHGVADEAEQVVEIEAGETPEYELTRDELAHDEPARGGIAGDLTEEPADEQAAHVPAGSSSTTYTAETPVAEAAPTSAPTPVATGSSRRLPETGHTRRVELFDLMRPAGQDGAAPDTTEQAADVVAPAADAQEPVTGETPTAGRGLSSGGFARARMAQMEIAELVSASRSKG